MGGVDLTDDSEFEDTTSVDLRLEGTYSAAGTVAIPVAGAFATELAPDAFVTELRLVRLGGVARCRFSEREGYSYER